MSKDDNLCQAKLSIMNLCIGLIVISNLLIEPATGLIARPKLDGQAEVQNTITQIRKIGFEVRIYRVKTVEKEGPYLNLYRIINPLADKRTLNRYPVLYGHGILFDAYSMVSKSDRSRPRVPKIGEATILNENGDEPNDYSFPFMLSNNNFDVWLYDARAASYYASDFKNVKEYKQSKKIWNFTLDTEALEDLPLVMNFVMEKTHAEKLVYVSFSESSLFMFALLSTRPEYADKLAAFVAMAPVTYLSYMHGMALALLVPPAALQPGSIGHLSSSYVESVNAVIDSLCKNNHFGKRFFCGKLMDSLGANGDTEKDKQFLDHVFKLTSLRALRQFAQILARDRFSMYDFGRRKNMQLYGRPNPPVYNLTKIKSDRIILARGGQDKLATPESQRRVISELGSKPYLDVFVKDYGHFSFLDGKDLITRANEPVLRAVYTLLHREVGGIQNLTTDLSFSFEPDDLKTR